MGSTRRRHASTYRTAFQGIAAGDGMCTGKWGLLHWAVDGHSLQMWSSSGRHASLLALQHLICNFSALPRWLGVLLLRGRGPLALLASSRLWSLGSACFFEAVVPWRCLFLRGRGPLALLLRGRGPLARRCVGAAWLLVSCVCTAAQGASHRHKQLAWVQVSCAFV